MHKEKKWTVRERVLAVLDGRKPDRLPFIDRMDFWYKGLRYQDKIPPLYRQMSLSQIHQEIGFGQEDWMWPYAFKYRQTEMIQEFEGEKIFNAYEPEITDFPTLWGMIPTDRPGVTTTQLITPVGRLTLQHEMLIESVISGTTRPQMITHPVRDLDDYRIYEYIIEHTEFVPHFGEFMRREAALVDSGYLVPMIARMPFQSLLIDVIGEVGLFYALYDEPDSVERLLKILDEQMLLLLKSLKKLQVPYIEFPDNLEGAMTNPRLFEKYMIPNYQRYAEILHKQAKKMGSHTDGDLKNLVPLIYESGLDVCESFTPAPITQCTIEEALVAWEKGPIIWGGIPSYYLEPRVPEEELIAYVEKLCHLARDRPIILGVGDAVMSDNDIERVRWIAQFVQGYSL